MTGGDVRGELDRPEADRRTPFSELPVSALIEAAAAPHRREGVVLDLSAAATSGTAPEPRMSHSPELLHGLGNLIQNAVQFARGRVALSAGWDDEFVEVTISDDGPGIPRDILDRLGEPYLSSRSTEGEHMGLGVFIATTLLERTGAEIEFANRGGGGARVRVRWPRAAARGATPLPRRRPRPTPAASRVASSSSMTTKPSGCGSPGRWSAAATR